MLQSHRVVANHHQNCWDSMNTSVVASLTHAGMHARALELMDDATATECDEFDCQARMLARQAPSNSFVSDMESGKPTRPRAVYDRGGRTMHSGATTFPADQTPDGQEKLALIIGLSGTGQTTTTFRNVLGSKPVQTNELEVFLLNTGRVGGGDHDERSEKVRIPDSAAVQYAVVNGNDTWVEGPDFGYLALEGVEADKLQHRKLYEAQGHSDEYVAIVVGLWLTAPSTWRSSRTSPTSAGFWAGASGPVLVLPSPWGTGECW
jgi:hypothetical protein